MNKVVLEDIANWLEGGAGHERITFNMEEGFAIDPVAFDPKNPPTCATAVCIAGAIVQFHNNPDRVIADLANTKWRQWRMVMDRDDPDSDQDAAEYLTESGRIEASWYHIFNEARDLAGLESDEAEALFRPDVAGNGPYDTLLSYNDPAWAARTIRHFIATGVVDWKATNEKEEHA